MHPFGVSLFQFCRDLCCQETRVPGLSCGTVCIILCWAVLVEHWLVTDRQTHNDGIYQASMASHSKNFLYKQWQSMVSLLLSSLVGYCWNCDVSFVFLILCVSWHFRVIVILCCQYQYSWLPGKTVPKWPITSMCRGVLVTRSSTPFLVHLGQSSIGVVSTGGNGDFGFLAKKLPAPQPIRTKFGPRILEIKARRMWFFREFKIPLTPENWNF